MDMRKIHSALTGVAMVFAVGLAAACGGVPGNTDMWGNDGPKPEPTCKLPTAPDSDGVPPVPADRPAGVNPGWRWVVIQITAKALDPNPQAINSDPAFRSALMCVPIDVHVYTRNGEGAEWLDCGEGNVGAHEPFDWYDLTPMRDRCIGFQYDPAARADPYTAPLIEVFLDVRYAVERQIFDPEQPLAMSCSLRIKGAGVADDLAMIRDRQQVSCNLSTNSTIIWSD